MNLDEKLVKSCFIQQIECENELIIWHSLFGYPKVISHETLTLIDLFRNPRSIRSILNEYEIDNGIEVFRELLSSYYLIPVGFDERKFLARKIAEQNVAAVSGLLIDYLELRVSEVCNFRCSYCILRSNLKAAGLTKRLNKKMNFQTAKMAIDSFIKLLRLHQKKIVEISFGGGEPLLNWPVIERIIEYCLCTYGNEFEFQLSINTNGSLITPEIVEKLQKYRIEVAPSLDGLQKGNNKVRITRDGKGTFESIVKVFDLLRDHNYLVKGVTATVNEQNFYDMDESFVDWVADRGMKEMQISIDVVNMVEIPTVEIVERLMRLRNYAKHFGIEVAGYWSRAAENLNESPLETAMGFCGATLGNNLCVDPEGDIYSCGYSAECLGNIHQFDNFFLPDGKYCHFVNSHTIGSIEICKGCMIEGQCGGGCLITREFSAASPRNAEKIKKMCDLYLMSTKELLKEQAKESS